MVLHLRGQLLAILRLLTMPFHELLLVQFQMLHALPMDQSFSAVIICFQMVSPLSSPSHLAPAQPLPLEEVPI